MKALACGILLAICGAAHADNWKQGDTYREVAYQIVAAIDWGQTLNTAKNPDTLEEHNAILGKHPSVSKVNTYFVLTGLVHWGVAYALPREYREAFQYVTIGVEANQIQSNFSINIGVKF